MTEDRIDKFREVKETLGKWEKEKTRGRERERMRERRVWSINKKY